MKKWIMAIALAAITACAETDGDWSFYCYVSTATITGYSGSDSIVTIPSTVTRTETYQEMDNEGNFHTRHRYYHYSVTSIRYSTFKNNTSLTSITIPSSITSIDSELFYGCTSLQFAAIYANISAIPYRTFHGCSSLMSVSLPDTITSIGDYSFRGCANLTAFSLPTSLTTIGRYAFDGCANINTPSVPSSVTSIGEYAFNGCAKAFAGELVLGQKITSLGMAAFLGCMSITSATVNCTIPSLPNALFRGCSSLESVVIGDGVKDLGAGQNSEWYYPFMACPKIKSFTVGRGITSIPAYYFGWHDRGGFTKTIKTILLPDTITSIGDYAFAACTNLTAFSFPTSVTTIGNCVFYQCDKMLGEKITLSPQVKTIGYRAFQLCTSLFEICFEGTPPSVGFYAFSDMAPGARGHYPRSLASEWLPQIDANGKWNGLIMQELSQPVLRVKSASPIDGTMTLAWDDGTDGQCVSSYSIYRSANDSYTEADRVATGITDTEWTDTNYWNAEPVLSPLNYWVVAESDHFDLPESNRVETRHRYGLSVGIDAYDVPDNDLDFCVNDARGWVDKLNGYGNFDAKPLEDSFATKSNILYNLSQYAQNVNPGDIFVYTHSSHGDEEALCCYDMSNGDLTAMEFASALMEFPKGIGLVVVLDTCYSGSIPTAVLSKSRSAKAMFSTTVDGSQSFAEAVIKIMGEKNVRMRKMKSVNEERPTISSGSEIGWLTAVAPKQLSLDSAYSQICLQQAGWYHGRADSNEDGHVSFLELGQFADDWFSRIFDDYMMSPQKFSTDVLASVCAGMVVEPAAYKPLLEKPQDVWASTNQPRRITVSWSADPNATRYEVMWTPLWYDRGDMAKEIREPVPEKNRTEMQREVVTEFDKDGYDIKRRMRAGDAYDIYVRAYNPMYSSPASKVVTGIAGEAFTTTTPSPIPNSYFDTGYSALLSAHNGDYEATALTTAANGVNKVWECYVTGISPTDETAKFEARIEIGADGKPVVKWSPDLNENGTKNERVYRVLGSKLLGASAQWDNVTDLQDYGAEQGYRFFKVDVELP